MESYEVPPLAQPPQRVVSLVPSVTESLFELGFGHAVVGVTDFCIYPAAQTAALPRVGGTRNARLQEILALSPDLVIANQEENSAETVSALREAGIEVWLTFPRTVDGAVQVLYDLAGLFRSQTAMLAVRSLAVSVDYARSAGAAARVKYFCPIWFDQPAAGQPWWMTFNRETYSNDVLALLGGENVFAERDRRYPLEADLGSKPGEPAGDRDTRYPRLMGEEIRASQPELVLLPSEPFAFGEEHREMLQALLPGETRYAFLDGSLITWHGTRLARALRMNLSNFSE